MIIKNHPGGFQIDEKRFYMPATIIDTCPRCGRSVEKDLSDDYLSFPTANAPTEDTMYCPENAQGEYCGAEWTIRVVLRVTLEAAP